MANLVAQMKEHLLSSCGLINSQIALPAANAQSKGPSEVVPIDTPDFSLDCSIQMLEEANHAGLSSRVSYHFPSRVPAALNDVFRYVDMLNPLLQYSKVFVVQDLDGDCSYYLRMDTVLTGTIDSKNVSALLDNVTQDVGILLQYFRYNIISQQPTHADTSSTLRKCG